MINNLKKRAASLLVGTMMISGSAGGGESEDALIASQLEHHQKQADYYEYIYNEDLSKYDKDFVNFYRNGYLVINEKEYSFNDLYLESGFINEVENIFLIYYKFPNSDILTGKKKESFNRTGVLLFKNAYVFYNIYSIYKNLLKDNKLIVNKDNINEIVNLIQSSDGSIHIEVPETSYIKRNR